MIESLMLSLLASLIGGLITYTIIKKMTGIDHILNISYELIDEMTTNVEFQKKVYLLGVLMGNGIKTGVGLGKGRGKFKFEDLIGIAMQHFFGGKQEQSTSTPQTIEDLQKAFK